MYHDELVLKKYGDKLIKGKLKGYQEKQVFKTPDMFGDCIPYGDPAWYARLKSPYYNDTHIKFRKRVRNFVDTHIISNLHEWENDIAPPKDLILKMGQEGLLACMIGTPFPKEFVSKNLPVFEDFKPEEFDHFHELIVFDEIARCGNAGVVAALTNGPSIAISAILKFGTFEQKDTVLREVLMGEKMAALAISEAGYGSDVAGIKCRANKIGDKYYVTGSKKWITNGVYADYFITLVKTTEQGQHNGLSLLLIHKDANDFTKRKINVGADKISGTAYLDFNNTEVPAKNLIGKENDGFKQTMINFNHERFYVTTAVKFKKKKYKLLLL